MMGEDEQRRIVLVLMWMHMQWIRSLAYRSPALKKYGDRQS